MTTTAATIELRVLNGRRRVASVRTAAGPGRHSFRPRAPLRPRRYRVQIVATTTDGQTAVDQGRLTVVSNRRTRDA